MDKKTYYLKHTLRIFIQSYTEESTYCVKSLSVTNPPPPPASMSAEKVENGGRLTMEGGGTSWTVEEGVAGVGGYEDVSVV